MLIFIESWLSIARQSTCLLLPKNRAELVKRQAQFSVGGNSYSVVSPCLARQFRREQLGRLSLSLAP